MRRTNAQAALLACAILLPACGGGGTDDDVVDAVPANARAYLHLDRGAEDWRAAREALSRMPALEGLVLDALAGRVEVPGDGEAGIALVPEPLVLTPDDEAAERPLEDLPQYEELLDGLPDERFAHGYVGRRAAAPLRALDGSVTAAAAAADLDGETMRVRLRALHRGKPGPCAAGRGGDELLDVADPDAALYLEVPSIGCAIRALAGRFEGVGGAFGRFARAAQRRGDVSLEGELLPLLDRRGALVATPGDSAPTLTLVVEDVEEQAALDVLSRLQPALIHMLRLEELGQAATFGSAEVEGITAATAQLAPGLELSYAAWDGRLVVSTALEGIAAVRRAEGLPGSDGFDAVLGDRPSERSALVFLDLNQLLTLGEQAGLAEDPRYLAIRDDLQKLRAAGAVLSREENFTTAELTFQIP
ncbi:MAG: hypothetical protein QOJ22_382 [Thermoleophilaceae bacterium]|nr:hypothetical protein [Thermoleophilaceae bacterium]